MNKSTSIALSIIGLIIVGGWYVFSNTRAIAPTVSNTPVAQNAEQKTATQGSYTAPMTALMITTIVFANLNNFEILFRDLSIAAMALALAVDARRAEA